jgi:hypothetical protein
MIFSANYHSEQKTIAGEIRCPYNQLGILFKYIQENPTKRYVVLLNDDSNYDKAIEQINILKDIAPYTISCGNPRLCGRLISEGYSAFVRYPVSDWETFTDLQDFGVSDIYIDGPLGFQADKLALGKGTTKIRTSPTMSPNASFAPGRKYSSFYIRPEDLSYYNQAIDIIDFKEENKEREDALLKIYARRNSDQDVSLLYTGLPAGTPNSVFKTAFVEQRLNCRQRCRIPGYSCHYCDNSFLIADKISTIDLDEEI